MTATTPTSAGPRASADPMRSRARLAGVLYLITFVSIPTLALYNPIRDHADFILGAGSSTGVLWGAFTEVIVGIAGISTALVLFPVLKRQNESAALGLVAARLVETTLIFVSVTSLLTIVSLRTDVAGTPGADNASLTTTGHTLLAVYDRTFLLSQSLMPVICDLLLGYLLFKSRLVPRVLPVIAFVGAPLLLASDIAIFFGVYDRVAPLAALAVIPVAVFELSVGIWLLVKGFNPASPLFARPTTEVGIPTPRAGRRLDQQGSELVR
jgi:hypothetical protein